MYKRYIVQEVPWSQGIERSTDPPVGRRIYGPGEVIELDETVHGVAGLLASGHIVPAPEEIVVVEAAPEATPGPRSRKDAG